MRSIPQWHLWHLCGCIQRICPEGTRQHDGLETGITGGGGLLAVRQALPGRSGCRVSPPVHPTLPTGYSTAKKYIYHALGLNRRYHRFFHVMTIQTEVMICIIPADSVPTREARASCANAALRRSPCSTPRRRTGARRARAAAGCCNCAASSAPQAASPTRCAIPSPPRTLAPSECFLCSHSRKIL